MSCLKLFNKYAECLIPVIEGKETEIINLISKHLESKNRKLKDTASSILVKFCAQLSIYISENGSKLYYKELLNFLLRKLKNMILQDSDPNVLITCIQSYGSLGRAVKTIQGDKRLHECLHFLIENTEATLFTKLDRFENFDFEKNPQNFKAVLFNQKQLISYLRSLSFIIVETSNLENYEVNFIFKIIKISIKYLTNYFPPYVKNLCESFSLFLNSLPVMNYNKIIFRLHVTTIIESMQKHCDVLQLSCEKLFRDYYEKVISDKLSLDKQAISLEQFLNILFNLVDKPEVKSIDVYSMAKIAESVNEKQFYYMVMLFVEIMQKEHFVGLIESQGKAALNLYCIAETKLIANPKNFLMLRLVSCLLNIPEVKQHINYSQETLACFKELVELIENTKNEYKDLLNVHQEFIVAAFRTVKEDFMIAIYKRFLMGVFASKVDSDILTIRIISSITYFLDSSEFLSSEEKKHLLENLLKFASNFSVSDSKQSAELNNSKKTLTLYLDDDSVPNEKILNSILEIVKLFHVDKQEDIKILRSDPVIQPCSLLSQRYLLKEVEFKFNNESLFVYLVNDILQQKEKMHDSSLCKLIHLLGKEIYLNYKSDIQNASKEDHERFLFIVKKTIKLLKVSTETNLTTNDDIFELLLLFFSTLVNNHFNIKQNIVTLMKLAKKLYITDFETLNKNNRTFLEIFCVLFRTCICKSNDSDQSLTDNNGALQEILDFIKINAYSPYESIQIFNIQIFEIFFNFLVQSLGRSNLMNDFFEIFVSIIQLTADDRETCSLAMKKTFEKLFELALVMSTRIVGNAYFNQTASADILQSCFKKLFADNQNVLFFEKLRILIKISSIDFLNESLNHYLQSSDASISSPTEGFRLQILKIFLTQHLDKKLSLVFELIDMFKQNQSVKSISEELKTFFLLLLNYDEMKIVEILLKDSDMISYLITFLFDGSNSYNDKNLKFAIERLSSLLAENEALKVIVLPMIIAKELKNDLFKNINDLSRNQFNRKLRSLYYFLKVFTTDDLTLYLGKTFIQILYNNLKDTILTRHETSLEFNKAKSLFNLLIKLKLLDVSFCYEIISQDKMNEFVKILHKNINRFQPVELQAIFVELLEAVYIDRKIAQFTKFLRFFSENKSSFSFEFEIDVGCFIRDQAFLHKNLNQFLEFLIACCDLKIQISLYNIECLQHEMVHIIKQNNEFDAFLLFHFLNIFSNKNLALTVLKGSYESIKSQLYKEIPINLSSLTPSTKEYEKFGDFVHNMFSLSAKIETLDFLSLTYFLMPDENSSFNPIFDFDSKQLIKHFHSSIDFTKLITDFVNNVMRSNSQDSGKFDYLLSVNKHIMQNFIEGLSNADTIVVLESVLLETFTLMETPLEQCFVVEEMNDLLIKKIILTNLLESTMTKLSRSEIVDTAFVNTQNKLFWDNKTAGLITKKLCLLYSQSLTKTPQHESKVKDIFANTIRNTNLTTNDKILKLLHTFTTGSYNLLVTLILKTQTKLPIILNFLLFNDSSSHKESNLVHIFPDFLTYDFKVLTDFQTENQMFPSLIDNGCDNRTYIEAFDTFNSQDQQFSLHDFKFKTMLVEPNISQSQDNLSALQDKPFGVYNPSVSKHNNFASFLKVNISDGKSQKNPLLRPVDQPKCEEPYDLVNFSLLSASYHPNKRVDELINTEKRQHMENFDEQQSEACILFELDNINQHPCMKKFMAFISTLIQREVEENVWVDKLRALLNFKSENLSLRLFLLKAILNHKVFFARHKVD